MAICAPLGFLLLIVFFTTAAASSLPLSNIFASGHPGNVKGNRRTYPSWPAALDVVPGDQSVSASWTKPVNKGTVQNYLVYHAPVHITNGAWSGGESIPAGTTSVVIAGLVNNGMYAVIVRAVTSSGVYQSSTAQSATYNQLPTGTLCMPDSNVHTGTAPHDYFRAEFNEVTVTAGEASELQVSLTYYKAAQQSWLPIPSNAIMRYHDKMAHLHALSEDHETMLHVHPAETAPLVDSSGVMLCEAKFERSGYFTVLIDLLVDASALDVCVAEQARHFHGAADRSKVSRSELILFDTMYYYR